MNAIAIDIVGLDEMRAAWAQAPEIARAELTAAMIEADRLLKGEVQDATPSSGHGTLRDSIFAVEQVSDTQIIGIVGTAQPYAIPVELGSKPHFPPVESLIDWVRVKLGVPEKEARSVAFLVARKIARTGTEGAFMFTNTFRRLEPAVQAIFARARDRIVARLAGKA